MTMQMHNKARNPMIDSELLSRASRAFYVPLDFFGVLVENKNKERFKNKKRSRDFCS